MTQSMDQDRREPPDTLSRREMIEATAAALAATPLLTGAVRPSVPAPAGAAVVPVAPKFLTAAEHALLDELTELIIPADDRSPGARAALVADYIDGRLAESLEPDWQASWRSGLLAVDALAREVAGKPLLEATPEQRTQVLTRMADAERDPKTPAERFFRELKGLTIRGYYSSKIGIHIDQQYKGNVYQTGEYAGYDAK